MHSSAQITRHIGRFGPHYDHFKPYASFSYFSVSFFFFPTFVVLCSVAKSCLIVCNPWTAAHQAFLSFTISWSLFRSQFHWLRDAIQPSSVTLFLSCPQSSPASGSFPMSWLSASGGQSIGASASIIPMNIQGWFPLGLTTLISLGSKGRSRVFSSTTVWEHQFFSIQPSSDLGSLKSLSKMTYLHPSSYLKHCKARHFCYFITGYNVNSG